jgi:hypothetical protein
MLANWSYLYEGTGTFIINWVTILIRSNGLLVRSNVGCWDKYYVSFPNV